MRAAAPGTPILVRLQPDDLSALDQWIRSQPTMMSRPEAIRQLLGRAIKGPCPSPTLVELLEAFFDEDRSRIEHFGWESWTTPRAAARGVLEDKHNGQVAGAFHILLENVEDDVGAAADALKAALRGIVGAYPDWD